MTSETASNLKLPAIPAPRGRSPGSSPDVRRRSKERDRKMRGTCGTGDHHGFRLPRLFRGRCHSTATPYLTYSLTNLAELAIADKTDDAGIESSPSPSVETGKQPKWPLMKTLSSASSKHHGQYLYQTSTSSSPTDRRSPKSSSPQTTLPNLTAGTSGTEKPRSHSHSHRFPLASFGLRSAVAGSSASERPCHFKNIYDSKGNWIGFVERKSAGDGQAARPWSNVNTYFTRARSADDIFQLPIEDIE